MNAQLPLAFPEPAEDWPFLSGASNAAARAWLAAPETWPGGRLALFGEAGVGKTHAARDFCRARSGLWFDGETLPDLPVPPAGPVVVDGADRAAGRPALLHWLNLAAETGSPVLLTARLPPAGWDSPIPDLASRLRATSSVEIDPPDDALLAAILDAALASRQLDVPAPLRAHLLARLPRTGAAMRDAAARLGAGSPKRLTKRSLEALLS